MNGRTSVPILIDNRSGSRPPYRAGGPALCSPGREAWDENSLTCLRAPAGRHRNFSCAATNGVLRASRKKTGNVAMPPLRGSRGNQENLIPGLTAWAIAMSPRRGSGIFPYSTCAVPTLARGMYRISAGCCAGGSSSSDVREVSTFATGHGIRDLAVLQKLFGRGSWRKVKGVATIRLINVGSTSTCPPFLASEVSGRVDCEDQRKS